MCTLHLSLFFASTDLHLCKMYTHVYTHWCKIEKKAFEICIVCLPLPFTSGHCDKDTLYTQCMHVSEVCKIIRTCSCTLYMYCTSIHTCTCLYSSLKQRKYICTCTCIYMYTYTHVSVAKITFCQHRKLLLPS